MAPVRRTSPGRIVRLSTLSLRFAPLPLGCFSLLLACGSHPVAPIYVVVGPDANDHLEFRPTSSYAELLVLPGQGTELKITLASYATSCDAFVTPGDHDVSVAVTVLAPAQAALGPGSYPWSGHAAHGGSDQLPDRAYALPTVRLGHVSQVVPAGGELKLESVATTPDGRVRGLLGFEFPGDAQHVATSLKGSFEAKLCRVRL